MKIIIAGIGKIGANLTKQLAAQGYEITVIDANATMLQSLVERFDVIAINGNCASMSVLLQAGVKEADLLIAATDADEKNLLCCMTAQAINRQLHTIGRIRNPDYSEQMYGLLDAFSLSLAINPERQAAREIKRLLNYPGFNKRETFARGRVEIVELRIDASSKLCDVPLHAITGITKSNVLICTVVRNGVAIIPGGDFVLQQGDKIFVTASTEELSRLLKNLNIITRKIHHVIICGGGRVSRYLAQALAKSDMDLRIIEQDAQRCLELAEMVPHATIIHGDASDQAVLEREGIDHCDALVSMTGMDELNMVISMYAEKEGVPHVVTKLSRMATTHPLIDGLNLGSVVCPKEYTCNAVVRYVRAMKNQTGAALSVHNLADGRAEALEFLVEPGMAFCNLPLKKLSLRPNVLVAAITRGTQTELAMGNSHLEEGDVVIVVKSGAMAIMQLSDIFT